MKNLLKFLPVLFLSTAVIISCETKAGEVNAEKPVLVKLSNVNQVKMHLPIRTSGLLYASKEVPLSFKSGGLIDKFFVNEGQTVKPGQLLAQLNLQEISAYREQAKSAVEKAERDMQRVQRLYDQNVATLEQKQNSQTALDVAKANLQIASFNEAHSHIYSPTAGRILKRFGEPGQLVGAGTPVIAFGSTEDAFILKVGVTDKDVIRLRQGDSASVSFDAYPSRSFRGYVTQIAGAVTPGSGTFQVELQIENKNAIFLSGFVGTAVIYPGEPETFQTIPVSALLEASSSDAYVFIVKESKAEKIPVKIRHIFNDEVAISPGLLNTDKVITEGNAYLNDGLPVILSNN